MIITSYNHNSENATYTRKQLLIIIIIIPFPLKVSCSWETVFCLSVW